MTDNEKAATFIGWKPNDSCDDYFLGCKHQAAALNSKVPHQLPAPDMSDPRNYMKALQSCEYRAPWRMAFHPDEGVYHITFHISDGSEDGRFIDHSKGLIKLGDEVVSALAMLYDAEHPNG